MRNWMKNLSDHYHKMRKENAEAKLMIVFDIDGTIIDMRFMILSVLQAYDRKASTDFFGNLKLDDINVHENEVESLLKQQQIPAEKRKDIIHWYLDQRWSQTAILEAHRPFQGVLEVIRWFQIQINTFVGLNTGRPVTLKEDTLKSLNKLGEEFRVHFVDELLQMNKSDWEVRVGDSKILGLQNFQKNGYKIIAFIDNEPANLEAVSQAQIAENLLLLHAETIFESKRRKDSAKIVSGKEYDLTELITERELPKHIQFVWQGVNTSANIERFLASDIRWAELNVQADPFTDQVVLRHDDIIKYPQRPGENLLSLDTSLKILRGNQRSAKLDLKSGESLIDEILRITQNHSFNESELWFNGNIERLGEEGFRKLSDARPSSIIQCPIDFLGPLIVGTPKKAKEILEMLREWGINRFSISWRTPSKGEIIAKLDAWGYEINIYNIPDLESFLQAVLLLPHSITSDFEFPKWYNLHLRD
ncbi:MAG: hypothetical protein ACFFGZ_11010 [Candidatus Thorarchaeota archaeon]